MGVAFGTRLLVVEINDGTHLQVTRDGFGNGQKRRKKDQKLMNDTGSREKR
jgi:hypothetical protein